MEYPKRKSPRMKQYDYSTDGYYFITIRAHEKKRLFSEITVHPQEGTFELNLSEIGQILADEIAVIPVRFTDVEIIKYVIMPNHVHILLALHSQDGSPSISSILQAFKSLTTRKCRQIHPEIIVFQKSFHDHIIRNQQDFERIWLYIDSNPTKWSEDCFFEPD